MTATAALTAQNTQGVRGIHEVPSDFVKQQIDACLEDIGVDVVKTGMFFDFSYRTLVLMYYQECLLRQVRYRSLRMRCGGTRSVGL